MAKEATGIAIVGCGYVADSYRYCLSLHQHDLRLTGVYDRDPERLAAFTAHWGDRAYGSLEEALADESCQIIVNLTDPENHEIITRAAFAVGKHVYSEKPAAMTHDSAKALAALAAGSGLLLAAAPCNFLGEAVQTAWAAVRQGAIGKVRLVYAELDDGMVHKANYSTWISRSGRAWPARGEFEVGCTYEHAGYAIGPLVAMFGSVRSVSSFSSVIVPDKATNPPLAHPAPDFSSGCLTFDNGVVARITNSIVAPYDHRFRIIGDDGTIEISEIWDYASQVVLRRSNTSRLGRYLERRWPALAQRPMRLCRPSPLKRGHNVPTMDFMRGVADLADAIRTGRKPRLDANLAIHVTEVTEMLQHPERFDREGKVKSEVASIEPEAWAN